MSDKFDIVIDAIEQLIDDQVNPPTGSRWGGENTKQIRAYLKQALRDLVEGDEDDPVSQRMDRKDP